MFHKFRQDQFEAYRTDRTFLISNPHILINLERFFSNYLFQIINTHIKPIIADYNEANYLYPFWQQYPPDERGRKPRGDQFPWIEVGEHAIGCKLLRIIDKDFEIRDVGLPTGADQRIILKSSKIKEITKGFTDKAWLFLDIKSVGPRDDFDHTVMSHNQISGDGNWEKVGEGVKNTILIAKGRYKSHPFHCSLAPLYILSDGSIVPLITIVIKPVYRMLSIEPKSRLIGQPLKTISVISIPNGLLLSINPNYLATYPNLFFPGKDDKGKNPLKVRSRVSFSILEKIDKWRVQKILFK